MASVSSSTPLIMPSHVIRALHGAVDPVHALEETTGARRAAPPRRASCSVISMTVADVLEDLAVIAQDRMRHATDGARSIGKNSPVDISACQSPRDLTALSRLIGEPRAVFGMDVLHQLLERGQALCRVVPEDAIALLRPVGDGV